MSHRDRKRPIWVTTDAHRHLKTLSAVQDRPMLEIASEAILETDYDADYLKLVEARARELVERRARSPLTRYHSRHAYATDCPDCTYMKTIGEFCRALGVTNFDEIKVANNATQMEVADVP